MKPTWIIQRNLGSAADARSLADACDGIGCAVQLLEVAPFAAQPPDIDIAGPTIFYGATSLIDAVYRSGRWHPGVFFDDDAFSYSTWIARYGDRMLNADAELTTISDLARRGEERSDSLVFARPLRDRKEFAGRVAPLGELISWCRRVARGDLALSPECPILVAEPVGLANEWRLFMVAGKVVAGSHYRAYQRLEVRPEVPAEVVAYAETVAGSWAPSPVFVLDIGRSGDGLYIIELNCFNGSGFYAASIEAIARAVSDYVAASYRG